MVRHALLGAHAASVTRLTYAEVALATNPLAYYRMGPTAADELGLYNGTYVGSPTEVPGLLVGDPDAAMLAATGKRMESPVLPAISAGNWSVGAWIRPATLPQFGMAISYGSTIMFGVGDGAGNPGSNLQVGIIGVAWMDGLYTFPDTTSNHLVILTRDTTTIRAYVDAVEVATSAAVPLESAFAFLIVGATTGGASPFDGPVDEVAPWARCLTPAEIAPLYRVGMGL